MADPCAAVNHAPPVAGVESLARSRARVRIAGKDPASRHLQCVSNNVDRACNCLSGSRGNSSFIAFNVDCCNAFDIAMGGFPRYCLVGKPASATAAAELNVAQILFLRQVARRTWYFFETFVGPKENWLPPDNFQEHPVATVAHRTSPTNMGLSLLANLAAMTLDTSARDSWWSERQIPCVRWKPWNGTPAIFTTGTTLRAKPH